MTERPSDHLETLKTTSDRVRRLEDEIARARSIACYKPVGIEKEPTTGGRPHAKEDDIIKIIELEAQLKEEYGAFVKERERAHKVISLIEDPLYRVVLSRYYILRDPMAAIAEDIHYSRAQAYRVKSAAKRAYNAIYSDLYQG